MRHPPFDGTWAGFRAVARAALAEGVPPSQVRFAPPERGQGELFGAPAGADADPFSAGVAPTPVAAAGPRLPAAFLRAGALAACHKDADRWDLLYRVAHRLHTAEPTLLQQPYDADVIALTRLCRAVQREIHKCHAFVRFREVTLEAAEVEGRRPRRAFVAWYEPEHDVLALAAPHFVERFGGMDWSILNPRLRATFVAGKLRFGPGASRDEAPTADALEALWRTYYASVFNPARLNLRATRAEMPRRYWHNLPEASEIAPLRREAPARVQAFVAAEPPRAQVRPAYADLAALHSDLFGCAVCPWSCHSSQAVAGEGPRDAAVMLVGEQPGDVEDVRGRPFVGPAGEVLAQAMAEASLPRASTYLTNAVKHFKFAPRGKRRLHQKPNPTDVAACKGWLQAELALVRPRVLVCLGTTAALAVRGRLTKLQEVRGRALSLPACAHTRITYHPSAVLRAAPGEREEIYRELVATLRLASAAGAAPGPAPDAAPLGHATS